MTTGEEEEELVEDQRPPNNEAVAKKSGNADRTRSGPGKGIANHSCRTFGLRDCPSLLESPACVLGLPQRGAFALALHAASR